MLDKTRYVNSGGERSESQPPVLGVVVPARVRVLLTAFLAPLAVAALAVPGPGDQSPSAQAQSPYGVGTPIRDKHIVGQRGGPVIGLGDNRTDTLLDRRFQASGIKRVRVIVPYDAVTRGGKRRRLLDSYFGLAQSGGLEPLVSFYKSFKTPRRLPSVAGYVRSFRRFRARYPQVRLFSTWDEANFPAAQPTGRRPGLTARYYRALRRECSRGRCTVVTADFRVDGSAYSAWWLREFKRRIGGGRHIWGLVPHPDINRHSTARTRQFLRSTRGPVWATETGAVNFFGRGFRPNLKRQTSAMRFLMSTYPRVSRRLDRMYIYHWRAARGNRLWDSALLSTSGKPRPAYNVFFRALGQAPPR
jgi:hypothetical protein